MSYQISAVLALLLKIGGVALIANEIRGLILAGPVIYAMYQSGGSFMALYLGFCSLAGIALSVIVPMYLARKLQRSVQQAG